MARGDFPSAKQDQFMLRFPDGLRDRLKEEAANNGRSLNGEIIHRLENSFGSDAAGFGEAFNSLPKDRQMQLKAIVELLLSPDR